MNYRITTNSIDETLMLGQRFSQLLTAGDVVAFFGDLGSGKTCFTQGICRGLGVVDQVTSPTFTLINEYTNSFPVYHFDFYRISSEDEVYGLGYEEYFYGSGICLIEWADRVQSFLPINRIEIYLNNLFEQSREFSRDIEIRILGDELKKRNWSIPFDIRRKNK